MHSVRSIRCAALYSMNKATSFLAQQGSQRACLLSCKNGGGNSSTCAHCQVLHHLDPPSKLCLEAWNVQAHLSVQALNACSQDRQLSRCRVSL